MGFISNLEKAARRNYGNVQNKLPFLPKSPTKILGREQVLSVRRKGALEQFKDPQIKEILQFNIDNSKKLFGDKDGLMLGYYLEFLKQTDKIEGNVLELGTYKGVTTILFAKFLELIESNKKIHTFDTFEGIPYEDKFSTAKNAKGSFGDTSLEFVKSQYEKFGVAERIIIHKGMFENTLNDLKDSCFSFVLLDCDVYDASKFCLPFVDKRLNGIIAFDDYEQDMSRKARWGMTKAVDEFYEKINMMPIPHIKKMD